MPNLRLAVAKGPYDNENAYENVISYVLRKKYTGANGVIEPLFTQNIARQYREACNNSELSYPRYIWHFFITFSDKHTLSELKKLGAEISAYVGKTFQTVYGVDDFNNNHLHFAVNAYSYTNTNLFLTPNNMDILMKQILNLLHAKYPYHTTSYSFNIQEA